MTGKLHDKEVLLATGAKAPLFEVVTALSMLEVMLDGAPESREQVFALRRTCLTGTPLPQRLTDPLINNGAIRPDGTVDPVVREVVLAAVRGEGDGLFVVSPFTDPLDRALSDLLIGRMKVEAVLPPSSWRSCSPILRATQVRGDTGYGGATTRVQEALPRPGIDTHLMMLKPRTNAAGLSVRSVVRNQYSRRTL